MGRTGRLLLRMYAFDNCYHKDSNSKCCSSSNTCSEVFSEGICCKLWIQFLVQSNTRVPAPPQRTRRRDSVTSYHQEEQDKTESEPSSSTSPESSSVSTPNGSDATAVEQTTPKPNAIKVISSHQGTNAKPSSEFDLIVDYDLVLPSSSQYV